MSFGISSCAAAPACSDSTTRQALDKALDRLYAEVRRVAKVSIDVNDVVVVGQTRRQTYCKALIHLSVNMLEIDKQEHDVTIEYTVETTESNQTLVSITSPS